MFFKTFFEICDAFFEKKHPSIYNDIETIEADEQEEIERKEQEYNLCFDLQSCIINLITIFGYEKTSAEENELKYHIY
jgi:hypothetical protein